jgi:sirohydrochlorin ferrochelatase
VVEDIPRIVKEAQARFPEKDIRLAEYLGFDQRIVSIVIDRIKQALASHASVGGNVP